MVVHRCFRSLTPIISHDSHYLLACNFNLGQLMQGSSYLHELRNEPSVIPCKSQKTSDLSNINWGRLFPNGFYFALISGYSLGKDDMPSVGNLPFEQLELGQLEFQPSLFQFLEHSLQPLKMAGWIFWENNDIIQIDDTPIEVRNASTPFGF